MRIILLLVALFLATNALAQDAERVEAAQTMQQIGPQFQEMQANLARRIQEEMSP